MNNNFWRYIAGALKDKDFWRYIVGTLFTLVFTFMVIALVFSTGDKTALTAVIIILIGALILIAILPNVLEFTIGPRGVEAKLGRLENTIDKQQEQVQNLSVKVDTIEEQITKQLKSALESFRHYLEGLGFTPQGDPVTIQIDEPGDSSYSYYEPALNRIIITRDLAIDKDSALREYTNYVLLSIAGNPDDRGIAFTELLSGLAFYFPCSFNNRPFFAPVYAKDLGQSNLTDLSNTQKFGQLPSSYSFSAELQGDIWGAAFWEMRHLFGQSTIDKWLFSAWSTLQPSDKQDSRADLARRLLQIAPSYESEEHVHQMRAILEDRGLTV